MVFFFVAVSYLELSGTEFHGALIVSFPHCGGRLAAVDFVRPAGFWGGQPQRHGVAGQAAVVVAVGASAC